MPVEKKEESNPRVPPNEDAELINALDVIGQACASVVGNLETHQAVQSSLNVVRNRLGL